MERNQSSIAGSGRCLVSIGVTGPWNSPSPFLGTGVVALLNGLEKWASAAAADLQCVFSDLATGVTDLLVGLVFSCSYRSACLWNVLSLLWGQDMYILIPRDVYEDDANIYSLLHLRLMQARNHHHELGQLW